MNLGVVPGSTITVLQHGINLIVCIKNVVLVSVGNLPNISGQTCPVTCNSHPTCKEVISYANCT